MLNKTRFLLISGIIITMIMPTTPSLALSCAPQTLGKHFETDDAIIEGTVIHKEYLPSSTAALVTFEVTNVFKGDVPNPLTIMSNEGFYGYVFHEEFTYVIFLDDAQTGYSIPLCSPVFHSFPSISDALEQMDDSVMNLESYSVNDLLSEDERQKLEEIRASEQILREIEIERIQQGYAITWAVIIASIVISIGFAIFYVVRRLRK